MRPRFGAGVKTAAIVGVLVWFLSFVYINLLNNWMGVIQNV
jgi:hypothetical protein